MSTAFLLVITAMAFWPSLQNGFTHWDDNIFLTDNVAIRSLSPENIKSFFLDFSHWGFYKPLVLLSYAIEYHFFKLSPMVYHATNLVFHLTNVLLVFWLFYRITGKRWIAFSIALLFGIHPMHVESVAWLTERKDVLSTFFFLVSLIQYTAYVRSHSYSKQTVSYFSCLAFFILSLLCKPMALTLPFILLLLDSFEKRRWTPSVWIEKIPFVVIAGLAAALTKLVLLSTRAMSAYSPGPSLSLGGKIAVASYGLLFYLVKLFVPVGLSAVHPYPPGIETALPPALRLAPVIMALVMGLFVFFAIRSEKIRFGGLFFLITCLPTLQIISYNPLTIVCERYTYLPYLGLFYLIAVGLGWIFAKQTYRMKLVLVFLAIAVTSALSFITWQRCLVWKNDKTLWQDVLKQYPKTGFAYIALGNAYKIEGDYNQALANYNQALKLKPDDWEALSNRGALYVASKDYKRAITDLDRALSLRPLSEAAFNNRAMAHAALGELNQSIDDASRAIEIRPEFAEAYRNRADAFRAQNDFTHAMADYNAAISLKNDYADVLVNRGSLYRLLGDNQRAALDYDEAIRANPRHAQAYNNRANLYLSQRRIDMALQDYERALGLNPGLPEPYLGISSILELQGDRSRAIEAYKKYLSLKKIS